MSEFYGEVISERVKKRCVCGWETPNSICMSHKCKKCRISICMYPDCSFTSESQDNAAEHYRLKHLLSPSENNKVSKEFQHLKKKEKCFCGNLLPIRSVKIQKCFRCGHYKCNWKLCNFCSKSRHAVRAHQQTKHASVLFFDRDNYKYCVCNYVKRRDGCRSNMKCPYQQCDYIWCLIAGCDQNFLSFSGWRRHHRSDHLKDVRVT